MSFFICGFKADNTATMALEKQLIEILPENTRNNAFHIENSSLYAAIYGNKKVIRNVAIHDDVQGSWLLVIGTPLICLNSKQQEQLFLNDFLLNPTEALRNKIDGNFAVFAYDGQRQRFITATDFNNTTPIFYNITPTGAFFSSHELPLARFTNSAIDPLGFSQLIHLGVTWDTKTRFNNIKKMLPCEISIVNDKKTIHTERYWQPKQETMWTDNFDGHIQKWLPMLKNSVEKFYMCSGHKTPFADFTAGEDSRLIIALCHALGIPFKANVTGSDNDIDVIIATQAAKEVGFDLIKREKYWIDEKQLLTNAMMISVNNDAYQDFFAACVEYATDSQAPLDDYNTVKYGGVPGGEAFRGSYYLRGKALFPSQKSKFDYKFFTKIKYLLDYHPGLLKNTDDDFLESVYHLVEKNLDDVKDFPIGTQIDHMLRIYQTCFLGLKYKNPLYLPFATNQMTRSIYSMQPRFKSGGKLTKACTEILYPELAFIRTQNGVPTIRKTISRIPLFVPEYLAVIKKIYSGAVSRLLKWKQSNKWYYSHDLNAYIFITLFNTPPYSNWFSSSQSMLTGHLYNSDKIDRLLEMAKTGSCRRIPILGRIISQELALRWMYHIDK